MTICLCHGGMCEPIIFCLWPHVQRMPCPTNTSVQTIVFWDRRNLVPGLGIEFIEYRTACPTNTPVWTVFFEDFIVRWARGGVSTFVVCYFI